MSFDSVSSVIREDKLILCYATDRLMTGTFLTSIWEKSSYYITCKLHLQGAMLPESPFCPFSPEPPLSPFHPKISVRIQGLAKYLSVIIDS